MVVMVFEKCQTWQTRYYFGTYRFQKHIWLLRWALEFQDIKFPKFAKHIILVLSVCKCYWNYDGIMETHANVVIVEDVFVVVQVDGAKCNL
jgi:hypothetical protein